MSIYNGGLIIRSIDCVRVEWADRAAPGGGEQW
jgi:hypothetical protein